MYRAGYGILSLAALNEITSARAPHAVRDCGRSLLFLVLRTRSRHFHQKMCISQGPQSSRMTDIHTHQRMHINSIVSSRSLLADRNEAFFNSHFRISWAGLHAGPVPGLSGPKQYRNSTTRSFTIIKQYCTDRMPH